MIDEFRRKNVAKVVGCMDCVARAGSASVLRSRTTALVISSQMDVC